ncbi:TonB-dependent receptor [Sphingomonas sp. C3-2]|uniref:TonB-dependent receptor n=1 Tax=Sphingomonas sp. C3-2 TaxID=3062169 RepID=UPI00294B1D14|nr:TonB-dependent receptor [Sphingomonas sp. C3-2]WOK35350.1 TonB-dependent receptor [Sphingomonas sp. C3-2]
MLGASVMAFTASAATAQDMADANGGLADIVVTAQKRAQSLQDVPIAITAVSEAFLDSRDISSINQMESIAPNLRITRSPGNGTTSSIAIRGSSTTNAVLTNDPTVGIYLDGIYIGKSQGSVFDVADLERIEVLRGPQGTLYGRNTLSGALSLVTRKPSGELGGKIEASYGNYDYKRLRASIDLPALGIFSAKLSGQMQKRDGFYTAVPNPIPGVTNAGVSEDRSFDNLNTKGGMIQVRAEPNNDLTFDYSFDISVSDQNMTYTQPYAVNPNGIFAPGGVFGGLNSFPAHLYVNKTRHRQVHIDAPTRDYAKIWGHGLTVSYDLGEATLKSITGYRKLHFQGNQDTDGTPLPIFTAERESWYSAFSEELQLTGSTGPVNYTLGLYYFKDKGRSEDTQLALGGLSRVAARYGFTGESYAAFGQLDYDVTDRLTLTGGLRYTHETKTIERSATNLVSGATLIDAPKGLVPEAKFNAVSPTAIASYKAGDETNIYAKFAKGFKSGGFNGETNSIVELLEPYRPEKVDAFEVGLKTRLLDNRLQLNVAGFWNEVKDMQLAVLRVVGNSAIGQVRNAGKARIRGFEIEATAQPSDDILIQASLSYTDPKYKEFIDNGVNQADNRSFNRVPNYTAFSSVDWTAARGDWGKLNLIADVNFVSDYHTAAFALRGATYQRAQDTKVDGHAIVNARIIVSEIPMGASEAEISLWSRNLFNSKAVDNFIDFGAGLGGLITASYVPPRTYGVTLGFKF